MSVEFASLRNEQTDDHLPDTLPEQGGGSFLVILPQTLSLRLPADVMQAWEAFDDPVWQDDDRKLPLLDPATGKQQVTQRIRWKFDKDHPLVIVAPGTALDGQPCPSVQITNIPRRRSKKPDVPKVSDATYLLRTSLAEPGSTLLTTPRQWVETMAKHAGHVFKVESGLSAYCNPAKTRYLGVPTKDASGVVVGYDSVEDPSGTKGCGKRWYSGDFKSPQMPGGYVDRRFCSPGCGAYLRGFFTIERFLAR